MTDRNIWVFMEQEDGHIADVSLELLAKASELARTLNSQVWGLVFGHQIEALGEKIIQYDAHRPDPRVYVLLLEPEGLGDPQPAPGPRRTG